MYGIVNKAIEDLIRENFGSEKWELIRSRSGVEQQFFISNEPYDDSVTYRLAAAASDEMGIPLSDILRNFGEWWVLRTSREKYGSLMESGGASLREFLINLPYFHNRIMLIYPKIMPPEFKVTDVGQNSLKLHYFSKREGLKDFVYGLLSGIGKLYHTPLDILLIECRDLGHSHDIYQLNWR